MFASRKAGSIRGGDVVHRSPQRRLPRWCRLRLRVQAGLFGKSDVLDLADAPTTHFYRSALRRDSSYVVHCAPRALRAAGTMDAGLRRDHVAPRGLFRPAAATSCCSTARRPATSSRRAPDSQHPALSGPARGRAVKALGPNLTKTIVAPPGRRTKNRLALGSSRTTRDYLHSQSAGESLNIATSNRPIITPSPARAPCHIRSCVAPPWIGQRR